MEKQLSGRKVIVLAENQYEDLELWYPVLRLREAGAEVVIAGTGADTYQSKHGYPVKADTSVDRVHHEDFEAVVIPGGYAPDKMRTNPHLLRLVRDMFESGKLVAAICHAIWVPASAEILKGKRVTCWPSVKDDAVHAGAEYVDAEVVRDGNLVTSRMPSDLGAFCNTIIEVLLEAAVPLHP